LTDFDEIWHDNAYWLFTSERSLKIPLFEIQDGGGCHLENHINRDISAMV